MGIKHLWSILCKESVINQDDNILHINGVLEELIITLTPSKLKKGKLPDKISIPINYEVVSYWYREKAEKQITQKIRYALFDPDKKQLFSTEKEVQIPTQTKRFRSRMKISGFPVTKQGIYYIKVDVKNKGSKYTNLTELPIDIKIHIQKSTTKN